MQHNKVSVKMYLRWLKKVNRCPFLISPQNCKQPAQLQCSLQGTCTVSFYADIILADCTGKLAHYLGVEYRFIPRKLDYLINLKKISSNFVSLFKC